MKTKYILTNRFYLILNNIKKLAAGGKFKYVYKPQNIILYDDRCAIVHELINRNFYVEYTNGIFHISWDKFK